MKLSEAFGKTRIIRYKPDSPEVMETVASLFLNKFADVMELKGTLDGNEQDGIFHLGLSEEKAPLGIFFRFQENGSGALYVKSTCYIYSFVCDLLENRLEDSLERYLEGKHIEPAFDWNRVTYDYFLTQEGRIQKDFNRETYIAELARLGFTHIEVKRTGISYGIRNRSRGRGISDVLHLFVPLLISLFTVNLIKDFIRFIT